MPTASTDLLIASSVMIVVFIGAVYGLNMVVEPYLQMGVSYQERHQQIVRYMLLSRGTPEDWGVSGTPTTLGLASDGNPYELDIDKISRLNPENVYALNYTQAWRALGIPDVSFRISVSTVYNLTLDLSSVETGAENTSYTFSALTLREGYHLPSVVRYYVLIGNHVESKTGTTSSNGSGTVTFVLPNSYNGTALMIGIAKLDGALMTYGSLLFAHNMEEPHERGIYATLSPLNYTLSIELEGGSETVGSFAFSFDYMVTLVGSGGSYEIPRLLDPSPIVLAVTGLNGSMSWVEWVAYPQVPLILDSGVSNSYSTSDINNVVYLVDVKGVLYRLEVCLGGYLRAD